MNMIRRHWKLILSVGMLLALTLVIGGCAGAEGAPGADGAPGMDAAATCSQCHNDTTLIVSKSLQAAQQLHMTGTATAYAGARASCTACHSSEGFTAMIAAGVMPDEMTEAPANPSNPNCRTCHDIHDTYTGADWALSTTAPVTQMMTGATFDSGDGNLCASCHQARRSMADVGFADGADVTVDSTHWGPHYGTVSNVLLGQGAYGVSDNPSVHYTLIEDGCITCHMADENHTLVASTAGCQSCHADLDTFDRNGVQTDVEELHTHLGELLEATGLLHDGHPVADTVGTEAEVGALWNYLIVKYEGSMGVHNPAYTKAMLDAAIATLE